MFAVFLNFLLFDGTRDEGNKICDWNVVNVCSSFPDESVI